MSAAEALGHPLVCAFVRVRSLNGNKLGEVGGQAIKEQAPSGCSVYC